MLLIRTDHSYDATAAHDLAFVANPFHRRSNFHDALPSLLQLLNNPPSPYVGRRELDADAVADQHADEVSIDPIGDVRQDRSAHVQLHSVQGAGQLLDDRPNYFTQFTRFPTAVFAATETALAVKIHGSPGRPGLTLPIEALKCQPRLMASYSWHRPHVWAVE